MKIYIFWETKRTTNKVNYDYVLYIMEDSIDINYTKKSISLKTFITSLYYEDNIHCYDYYSSIFPRMHNDKIFIELEMNLS